MRYSDFENMIASAGAKRLAMGNFRDSDLPERLEEAKSIRLVSGEFHPYVYNDSPIVRVLDRRWRDEVNEPEDKRLRAALAGGPNVYLLNHRGPSAYGLTGFKNDLVHLLSMQFEWPGADEREIYQVLMREQTHYWVVDGCYVYFQEPHDDETSPEKRTTYFVDSVRVARNLEEDFERKIHAGLFRRLYTAGSIENLPQWKIRRKPGGEDRAQFTPFERLREPRRPEMPSKDEIKRLQDAAKAHFLKVKNDLMALGEFKEKYVAVIGAEIVDIDDDDSALFERVAQIHPTSPVYIGFVSDRENVVHVS